MGDECCFAASVLHAQRYMVVSSKEHLQTILCIPEARTRVREAASNLPEESWQAPSNMDSPTIQLD